MYNNDYIDNEVLDIDISIDILDHNEADYIEAMLEIQALYE